MQTVALIDYGSGNLHSAHKALVRAAQDHDVSIEIVVTSSVQEIEQADRVLLPGVGAFGACMAALQARSGIAEALEQVVLQRQRPFLGVCVGMQLLASEGIEHGHTKGLGWIPGQVIPIEAKGLKIPHMGWNDVEGHGHPLLPPNGDAYFVHSYRFAPEDPSAVVATTHYGETFPAMVAHGNIAGVQFHPEKSQHFGLSLLARFLTWEPS